MKLRNSFLMLLFALLLAGQSAALTLGRVRGAAVVGQSLDVSVQIQLNADEAATALCLEADVFHADARQDPSRVRVTAEPTAQPNTVNARVISLAFIDEPMVTVYLRAGCTQKSSRRYVLLADFPSEPALPVLAPSAAPAVVVPAAAAPSPPLAAAIAPAAEAGSAPPSSAQRTADTAGAPPPSRVATAAAAGTKPAAKARPAARPRPPKVQAAASPGAPTAAKIAAPAPVVAAAPAASAAPASQAIEKAQTPKTAIAPAGQSRLTLDPLVGLTERVAILESSASATGSEGARNGVQDTVRDGQRMQSLEDSVKALVALAAKNEASLQEMRVKLQTAQADRVPVQWLYGLVALVLACLAAMAFLWSRLSAGAASASAKDDWWRGARNVAPAAVGGDVMQAAPQEQSQMAPGASETPAARPVSKPASLQGAGGESRYSSLIGLEDNPSSELDVSLVEMTESNFDQLMKSGKSHSAIRPGPLPLQVEPMPATTKLQALPSRPINSEQLFDVRQQADFFVSLGQTDQAVQILEKQINDHGETSPLIYLDLLQIFHSLNLKTDFRQFREDFNLLFNARVPEFASFRNEGKSLEEYPHVLAHITALWSTRKALMVIEASIFRDSLDDRSSPFDLAAFRDLLLLHAIAQSFTIREEPTSDLAPLRSDIAPISKGARLSPLSRPGAPASGPEANGTVDISLPPISGSAPVDISLNSSGMGLMSHANSTGSLTALPSVTAVLNAPTALDRIARGQSSSSSGSTPSGSGALDLELDLDLSDLVELPLAPTSEQKPSDNEASEFSKLLKAQAPARAGTQGAKAKSAAAEAGNLGAQSQAGYLADNLLDFDLSSDNAGLTANSPQVDKPPSGKRKPI